ncbi:ABC transporter ATP-binding protein [Paraburkholderia hospita]|jgi:urea ABC transporter ATP-binding protein UrtE|uniref:ABC transporter ATP-binding protein n=1 Tax=Paraburkholderia hospita TaxID=169430 RepID=A0AAJ4SZZ4_9BURK|nr:ATP-binding cassette domain-containing protein [Paraburkholderia hospita]EUC11710.1 Sulfate-transporting ATPase [Burkholderia sp. BT03]SKD02776.1 amino acid/amide ABC transporter ATP-binding protein 2, HAAT family [Burkholderia sp. CF099]SOE89552.1 amino acid/amide ABC transporter ATP-binding protein 2, HAAT family [Burkholderia sp. YR290]AUT74713.1 ABC transporter ATP-binding protein [Paraburkholderia hospita]EIN02644.1 branched-chain amino acid ABC transporter ATP-binding protein [Parabur
MLEANGLCAGYGAIPVLYGVALSVRSGEAVGILGHNGMGKTTLLRTLIGALPATAGTIHFNHDDVTALAPHARAKRGMAYVPQGREIFPTLSAYDNLRLGLVKTGRKPEAAIDALLEDFPRLRPLLDRAGGALSGGEQQLLALARALAGEPSMLLLDEPTEGIQPSIIEEIAETLVSLREKRGLTIVLVEQNLDFIAAVSQRVLVIRRGRIGDEIPREHLTDLDKVSEYTGVHA